MKVYFTNFWDGFYDYKDAVHIGFFLELFTRAFGEEMTVGSLEESDILCESIFGVPVISSVSKKFKYTVLFSGESRLNGLEDQYSIVLCGERNHKNRINCPLFVPYRWCNQFLKKPLEKKNELDPTTYSTPFINRILCVIGNDGGIFRNQYLDKLESRGIPVDYAGSFRKNTSDPRIENTRYFHKKYLQAVGEYKFVLAMENSRGDTYITEKIINPLEAGTIPIYWGSPRVGDYFNGDRCILVGDSEQEQEESMKLIEHLMVSPEEYHQRTRLPAMNNDWRTLEDLVSDLQSFLHREDLFTKVDTIRIISSQTFEPRRYENLLGMMERLEVHPSRYCIYAPTYKHTITQEIYQHFVRRKMIELIPWVGPYRQTKLSELSLFLNYYWHLEDIDRRYKDGIFLTLESDVQPEVCINDFPSFISKLGVDWSLLSIGFGAREDVLTQPPIPAYLPYHIVRKKNTRCTDSLLWTKKGIEQFLERMRQEDYSEPFDHYLCRFAEENDTFVFYWSEPALFKQQSNYGNDPSTIQNDG